MDEMKSTFDNVKTPRTPLSNLPTLRERLTAALPNGNSRPVEILERELPPFMFTFPFLVGKHLPSEQAKRSRISHKFNADLTRMSLLKSNRTREFVTYSALALHSQ